MKPAEAAAAYAARIAALHRELGLAVDYAATRGLPLQREADEAHLRSVATLVDGREVRLVAPAAEAWRWMQAAARGDGVGLEAWSGFRSVARQAELIRAKRAGGATLADILRVLAAPGYSEHHTGRAVDVGTPGGPGLVEGFARTDAYAWLEERGENFGFRLSFPRGNPHGIAFEPWHWCWAG